MSDENPSEEMKDMTRFICKVYAPCWFGVKFKPNLVNGAAHTFREIDLVKKWCTEEVKEVYYIAYG